MIDANKIKVGKFDFDLGNYVFTDESEKAQLSLNFITNEYGIDYYDAIKVCAINKGARKINYYGHWYFPTEDDATSALIMLKLMRC